MRFGTVGVAREVDGVELPSEMFADMIRGFAGDELNDESEY